MTPGCKNTKSSQIKPWGPKPSLIGWASSCGTKLQSFIKDNQVMKEPQLCPEESWISQRHLVRVEAQVLMAEGARAGVHDCLGNVSKNLVRKPNHRTLLCGRCTLKAELTQKGQGCTLSSRFQGHPAA